MRIQTLGSAEIIIGQTALRPDSAVAFGLLLYLGMTAGDRVSRARLVELFWPELPETQARHALRQLLYRLRRYGLPLAEGGEELRVEPSVVECDVSMVFAPAWADECDARQAAAVGQFLIDFSPEISVAFSEWLDDLRNRVARRFTEAALRHLRTARRESRWTDVFDWSTRCLDVDPLNEEATYGLAESTAMRGAKVEAVRILDEYSRELGELDGKIGLSTKVLRQRVSEAHGVDRQDGSARLAMVGRDEEVARLVRIVEDTMRGRGGVTWIVGVAGIGKSRLATEVRREAVIRGFVSASIGLQSADKQRPFSVLSGAVTELLKMPGALGCSPKALATLQRLVAYRESLPGTEAKPREPNVQQYEIREAIADLIEAIESEAPLLIHIDDYHSSDSSSVPILTDLIERSSAVRVLWLLTSRPLLQRPPFTLRAAIELKPLSDAACRQLVELTMPALPEDEQRRLADACTQVTGGNPFFAHEVIRFWDRTGGERSLPRSVTRAVTDHVSRLEETTLRLLQVIAMLGGISTLSRVTRVMDCSLSALWQGVEDLDSLGIVTLADDGNLLSMHDIWRDEVLKSIRPMVQRVIHARIADVVEDEAQRIREVKLFWHAAVHRGESGEPERAIELLESYAAHLMEMGLPEESAATMRHALSLCRTPSQELDCRRQRIRALHAAAKWSLVQTEIVEAVSLARTLDPRYDEHEDLELLATEAMCRADNDLIRASHVSLVCGRERRASIEHRICALLRCAVVADNLCENDTLQEAYDLLRELAGGDSSFRSEILMISTIYNTSLGDLDLAIVDSSELVAIRRSQTSVSALTWAIRISATPLRTAGQFSLAIERLTESLRISEKYSLSEDAATCCDALATIALEHGELKEAKSWIERAESWASNIDTSYWRLSARMLRASLALGTGDAKTALGELGTAVEPFAADQLVRQALNGLSLLATAFRIENRPRELREAVSALDSLLPKMISRGRTDQIVYNYITGLQFLGDSQKASSVLRNYLTKLRRDRGNADRLRTLLKSR